MKTRTRGPSRGCPQSPAVWRQRSPEAPAPSRWSRVATSCPWPSGAQRHAQHPFEGPPPGELRCAISISGSPQPSRARFGRFQDRALGRVLRSFLPGTRGFLHESGHLASLEDPLGVQEAEELDEFGHQPGPAGLMTGTQPGAVVAVEVLEKEDVLAPVRV